MSAGLRTRDDDRILMPPGATILVVGSDGCELISIYDGSRTRYLDCYEESFVLAALDYSASAAVGPTPGATPACECKEELTDILRILDAAPSLPLDSCTPEELQEWTTAIKSVLVHIGVSLRTPATLASRPARAMNE